MRPGSGLCQRHYKRRWGSAKSLKSPLWRRLGDDQGRNTTRRRAVAGRACEKPASAGIFLLDGCTVSY